MSTARADESATAFSADTVDRVNSYRAATVRVARGIHVSAEQVRSLSQLCFFLLEHTVRDAVIASITAARLHGLWLPPGLSDAIHIATATPLRKGNGMSRTRRPEFVAHRFQLREVDVVSLDGLLVTSLARAWRDLACVLDIPDLVAAGDSALRAGATVEELADAIAAGSQRHHVSRARQALPLLNARSRSRGESHLRVAVSGPDMPVFQVNESVSRSEGGWLAEPDLSLPAAKLALEYQGADHAGEKRMRKDITRFADMRRDRWSTLAFGPAEVFGRPWQIKPEVRDLIADRAPELLPGPARRSVVR